MMIKNNRVLIIKLSPVYGLDSSMMRALAMAKGFVGKGFTVDLLTLKASATHTVGGLNYDFLENINLIYANPNKTYDAIVAGAASGLKRKLVAVLRNVYHKFSLFNYTASIAKNIRLDLLPSKEYEYVLAISDPKTTYIAARNLIRQGLCCNKLIEYWGDPLYGDITLKSLYPGFVYKRLEKKLLSIADKIVYTSPFTLAEEQALYPAFRDRMCYLPTPYLEKKVFPRHEGKYTVGYYGAYPSNIRNILPLYEACKQMKDTLDLKIVGNSDLTLESAENIEIRPRGDIRPLEAVTDLFVCVLNKSGTQIPGKLYHYAAYNKPVLVIEDGDRAEEMHRFIQSFGRYVTCRNEEKEIRKAIADIISRGESFEPCEIMDPQHLIDRVLE